MRLRRSHHIFQKGLYNHKSPGTLLVSSQKESLLVLTAIFARPSFYFRAGSRYLRFFQIGFKKATEMSSPTTALQEPPITFKSYIICAFAAFGGILFGYDSGYISGVLAMDQFKLHFGSQGSTDPQAYMGYMYETWQKSLITSMLSAGTFFGALGLWLLCRWDRSKTYNHSWLSDPHCWSYHSSVCQLCRSPYWWSCSCWLRYWLRFCSRHFVCERNVS